MSKGIIIAGFSGVGKTELAKKYVNVIDLDPADYVYDNSSLQHLSLEARKGEKRPINPNWPNNYIREIKKAVLIYDFVLVWDREDIIKEYLKNKFDFILCYPQENDLKYYVERYRGRGNSEKYIKMKLQQYCDKMTFFEKLNITKIILKDNATLEDYLIDNNYKLISK